MFNKKLTVGIAVTKGIGLELAVVDFESQTVLKYATKPLEYNSIKGEIADLDVFKEALRDILDEQAIPKGAEIVLSLPSVSFKISEFPAALTPEEVKSAVVAEYVENPLFLNIDFVTSVCSLPSQSLQFQRVVSTAAQHAMISEIAVLIRSIGYVPLAIDTSTDTSLKALIYSGRVNYSPSDAWVLLQVEEGFCRVLLMQGQVYIDCFEESVSIAEVLGDEENYSTILSTVIPILKNLPSRGLFIHSKTGLISAEILANKINYVSQIVYSDDGVYSSSAIINVSDEVETKLAKQITSEVIGAAIYKGFSKYSPVNINLYNEDLGPIYTDYQPFSITLGEKKYSLTVEKMSILGGILLVLLLVASLITHVCFSSINKQLQQQSDQLTSEIKQIERFLEENNNISTSLFDEGIEIKSGLTHNKDVYAYYTMLGTETPKKLWLTSLSLSDKITVEGQADNIESVYSFFHSLKDYNPSNGLKLQKLGLANAKQYGLSDEGEFDTNSILTSLSADFYTFKISNAEEEVKVKSKATNESANDDVEASANNQKGKNKKNSSNSSKSGKSVPPPLEPVD